MECNDKLKEIVIKNCASYYFDDIINIDNILVDEKLYENIFVYNILYKSLIDSKLLCIRFNKIDGFIRVYNGTRYLVLFGSEKYDCIDPLTTGLDIL